MRLYLLNAFLLAGLLPLSLSAKPEGLVAHCSKAVRKVFAQARADGTALAQEMETFDDLLLAFTRGLVPNLRDPFQRSAFGVYRIMRFGNPFTYIDSAVVDRIADFLERHPRLRKKPFRNFRLQIRRPIYPVTEELTAFLNSQANSAGQIRGNLFQVDANHGYWKKVLGYKGGEDYPQFLDVRFPKLFRLWPSEKHHPVKERAKALYEYLMEERQRLKAAGENTWPISQAIADLIHTIGFGNVIFTEALKSRDGLERLNAFRNILRERDTFAVELGHAGGFDQVLTDLGISSPSGLPVVGENLSRKLRRLEEQMVQNIQVANAKPVRTVRHLSLVESPLRACIGGLDDCSTNYYPFKSLDPNYHYFTLTDEEGFSDGYITVVLGRAKSEALGASVKVAFVDKIQNISNADMPMMLEGVRRSVAEKGYTLGLPGDLGGYENGISNKAHIRSFIRANIPVSQTERLTRFRPHWNSYKFISDGYSRAQQGLPLRPVVPLPPSPEWNLSPGEIIPAWKVASIDQHKLAQASAGLNHGTLEDKLRYIFSTQAIQQAKLDADPDFEAVLWRWLKDAGEDFKLRKQALIHHWFFGGEELWPLLQHFGERERMVILQNLSDTPRYRDLAAKEKSFFQLILKVRAKKKIRDNFLKGYAPDSPGLQEVMSEILQAEDIADEVAVRALEAIDESTRFVSVDISVKAIDILRDSPLREKVEDALVQDMAKNIRNNDLDFALKKVLRDGLQSTEIMAPGFIGKLLSHYGNLPFLGAYSELAAFAQERGLSLQEAAKIWIQREDVDSKLKQAFLGPLNSLQKEKWARYIREVHQPFN